jgi:hypothetical protein
MASCSTTEMPVAQIPSAEHIKLIIASGITDHEIPSIMHNYWMDKLEEKLMVKLNLNVTLVGHWEELWKYCHLSNKGQLM